jgi:hypothetical protein
VGRAMAGCGDFYFSNVKIIISIKNKIIYTKPKKTKYIFGYKFVMMQLPTQSKKLKEREKLRLSKMF